MAWGGGQTQSREGDLAYHDPAPLQDSPRPPPYTIQGHRRMAYGGGQVPPSLHQCDQLSVAVEEAIYLKSYFIEESALSRTSASGVRRVTPPSTIQGHRRMA